MMSDFDAYLPEPTLSTQAQSEHPARPNHAAGVGVVLVNLGSPTAPTAAALKPYLCEFLSDPRVVELPRALWWCILHGVILTTRPAKSAQKYQTIWTKEGSPLCAHSARQAKFLRGFLGQQGINVPVMWSMRYGQPSLASALSALKKEGCRRIVLLPMYPQYAASTGGTVIDAACDWLKKTRYQPQLRWVSDWHDDDDYIAALAASVHRHWQANGGLDAQGKEARLLMSFHGLPQSSSQRGDPYETQCRHTGQLLAEALGLNNNQYTIAFQSRFGREEWLQPYTAATLTQWAQEGVKRADVICPGFTADCLETLEEIAQETRHSFLSAGGKEHHYIPALNEEPAHIQLLCKLVQQEMAGWLAA